MVDLLLYLWALFFAVLMFMVIACLALAPFAILLWIASMIHEWRHPHEH